jgi:hypothetical protein
MTDDPPAPPPPAPRQRRNVKRLVVVLVVMLVVCCAGTVAVGWALVNWYDRPDGPARAAAEKFLTALEKDDTAGAYRGLCTDVRDHLSQESFTNLIHAQPRLRGHKVVTTSVATVNGNPTALVTADLTREGNVRDRHTVRLTRDGSLWWVCGSPY